MRNVTILFIIRSVHVFIAKKKSLHIKFTKPFKKIIIKQFLRNYQQRKGGVE